MCSALVWISTSLQVYVIRMFKKSKKKMYKKENRKLPASNFCPLLNLAFLSSKYVRIAYLLPYNIQGRDEPSDSEPCNGSLAYLAS